MPTYEYKCDACGNEFEKFQSITSAAIKKCPKCGKNKVRRLIGTGGGLIFKGSGFYLTDYRDSNYNEKAKADTATSGSGDTKSETKSESKSETKPATTESTPAPAKAETKATESKPAKASKPAAKKE